MHSSEGKKDYINYLNLIKSQKKKGGDMSFDI
jgi:hypothetical protein